MRTFLLVLLSLFPYWTSSQPVWINQNTTPQGNTYSIKFFDANTGIGFCDNGVVIRTTNTGYSWQTIQTPVLQNLYASFFLNNSTGYAAGGGGAIIKTTNGGLNWILISSGVSSDIRAVFFTDSDNGYFAGSAGLMLKTTNAGGNWDQRTLTTKNFSSVYFTGSNTGYAAADTMLYKTTNAGVNWTSQNMGPYGNAALYFINALTGFFKTNRNIKRTTDGGVTWQTQTSLSTSNGNSAIAFLNSTTGFTVSGSSPMYRTTDAGLNWTMIGPGNLYPPFDLFCLSIVDSMNIFISGNKGNIFKATSTQYPEYDWKYIGGNRNVYTYFSFMNADTGYIRSGNLKMQTTTGGSKWDIFASGGNNWFEPSSYDFKKIVCKNDMSISISHSGGHAGGLESAIFVSSQYTAGTPFALFNVINDVELAGDFGLAIIRPPSGIASLLKSVSENNWVTLYTAPSGINLAKVSFHDNNSGVLISRDNNNPVYTLLRTSNGGANWFNQTPPVTEALNEIQLLPSGSGMIQCANNKLLRTTNFSQSWELRYNNGSVNLKTVKMLDDYNWYGLTTGSQFARSTDAGLTWLATSTSSVQNLNAVQFLDQNTGYIVGDSGTVLKTTNGGLTFVNNISENIPNSYGLFQNYPNPFNPVTIFGFRIAEFGLAKLTIYDALGKEIAIIVNEEMQPGSYNVNWDASNYPSGVYFYKLESVDFVESKKMVLIK